MQRFEQHSQSMTRSGVAKERGLRSTCKKKLCLISTDQKFLLDTLFEFSQSLDCHEVTCMNESREGAYFGQVFFTNDSSVGDAWARFESHPKLWAIIQNMEFVEDYKSRIRSY